MKLVMTIRAVKFCNILKGRYLPIGHILIIYYCCMTQTTCQWLRSATNSVTDATGSLTSSVVGVTDVLSGSVAGATGALTSSVVGVTDALSGSVAGATGALTSTVVGVTDALSGSVAGATGALTETLSSVTGQVRRPVGVSEGGQYHNNALELTFSLGLTQVLDFSDCSSFVFDILSSELRRSLPPRRLAKLQRRCLLSLGRHPLWSLELFRRYRLLETIVTIAPKHLKTNLLTAIPILKLSKPSLLQRVVPFEKQCSGPNSGLGHHL